MVNLGSGFLKITFKVAIAKISTLLYSQFIFSKDVLNYDLVDFFQRNSLLIRKDSYLL
ncbi:hypothetical protein PLAN_160192 [Planktothrix rubescens CCAP 1459/22]|uniref:Uncharacterized protein n=2 Tax=Planktothrix TaxID=54304 RepID=A0A1J1JNB6_PLAAG|nr:hypothetical protein PLAN_160192 [Planktothrix rubescens NIVA-CYA 18]CAD0231987.1 conserved hypothetical protein [Planktothrix agardhii]CUM61772.1 protein of unknown function [Planktothrix agardhii]